MAVYSKDGEGNILILKKGKTLSEIAQKIKDDTIKAGKEPSPCIQDNLNTKQNPKDKGAL